MIVTSYPGSNFHWQTAIDKAFMSANQSINRRLDTLSLTAMLVSAHYGLGFLLGTGEKTFTLGFAGSLYAFCLGLSTLALLALAKFYWEEVEQIWTLLGDRYGNAVKLLIGLMSWASLIGIAAVQIIAGAFILKVLGLPTIPTMVGLAFLLMIISLLPVEKASRIFQILLLLNIFALIYGLWVLHGIPAYLHSPIDFIPSLHQLSSGEILGISLSSISLVVIDMKYQQFVVQAKDLPSLYSGCLLAGIILLVLAFLPYAVVIGAQSAGILHPGINGKETIPFIIAWIGGGIHHSVGIILIMALVVPALGVGSNVLRIQTKTVLDFQFFPASNLNRFLVAFANAVLGLGIALKGGAIVNLIVAFYAAYVAAASISFMAYFLDRTGRYTFSQSSVKLSLAASSISALTVLFLTLFLPNAVLFGNGELTIMAIGMGFGIIGLFMGEVIEKYVPGLKILGNR